MTPIPPPSQTWCEWTDVLGQKYVPGDYVAYASVAGHSAHMSFGRVDRINRYLQNGQEIVSRAWVNGKHVNIPSASVRVIPIEKRNGVWSDEYTDRNGIAKQYSPKTYQLIDKVIKIEWKP